MKILIASDIVKPDNPFVETLSSELIKLGADVVCSRMEFWNQPQSYDIVHFQWPEALFGWKQIISDSELQMLVENLDKIKRINIPMCVTVHNLKPHVCKCSNLIKAYDIVYSYCSTFFHMGSYSKEFFASKYPNAKHIMVPHHIYDTIYHFDTIKERLRWIERDRINLLAFGTFRKKEERDMIIRLMQDKRLKNVNFILPGFCKFLADDTLPHRIKSFIMRMWYKCLGVKYCRNFVSDDETEQLFLQSDIVLIQRLQILNSGNLPMGFAAGKVVVGPDVGNVGSILRETNNPVFNPSDADSIVESVLKAIRLCNTDIGLKNKEYVHTHWRSSVIAGELIKAYSQLLKDVYKTITI